MTDVKKEVIIDIPANESLLTMTVHEESKETSGFFFKSVAAHSNYRIYHGSSIYTVDKIMFYNAEGVQYTNDKGWLEGAYGKRFRTLQLDIDEKAEFKKVTISDESKFIKMYKANQVCFTSLGKDWNGELRAVLYIPMTYLEATGYQVIKNVVSNDYTVIEEIRLYTPMFNIFIDRTINKLFDKIKADMIRDLQENDSIEGITHTLKTWATFLQ